MNRQSKWDEKLNLPDGISQQYQRRYSDPGKTRPKTAPQRPRRFSLTTFDDLKDVSSGKIRSCVGKILQSTGFTASAAAKCNQMRRYSLHVDPEVENHLGDRRRKSLGTSYFARSVSLDNGANTVSTKTHGKMLRKRSLTSYMPRDSSDGGVYSAGDFSRFRNSTEDDRPLTPDELCFYDPRKSRLFNLDEYECPPVPKCKYKLRDNELLSSELASSFRFGVQIEDSVVCDSRTEHGNGRNTTLSNYDLSFINRPETPSQRNDIKRICSASSIKRSSILTKQSNLPSNCSPASMLETSSGSISPTGKQPIMRHNNNIPARISSAKSLRKAVHGSLTNKKRVKPETNTASSDSRNTVPVSTSPLPQKMAPCALLRRNSKLNFEILGSKELHGSPQWSGRLKVCFFRSPAHGK